MISAHNTIRADQSAHPKSHELSNIRTTPRGTLRTVSNGRGSAREEALRELINEFKKTVLSEYAQNRFITLTHRCENSLKRGSILEIDLALQFIGLIVITVGAGDNAHEIYEYSQSFLPQVLKFKSSNTIKVLECLAIVTFVGAQNSDETENTMGIIWKFINEESKVEIKHPPNVVAAAISAWSLLLASINGWCVNHKKWKGLIPYLVKQLEEEDYDEDVHSACIEALGLIFENKSLEKFSNEAENYANIKDMKDDIVTSVSSIVTQEIAEQLLLEDSEKKMTLTISETKLTLTTFSLVKQINYLKEFLGDGFVDHMRENKYLHDIFKFVPQTISTDEEEDLHGPEFEGRISMSSSSFLSKGKTQLRNKNRMLAEDAKLGGYRVDQEFGYDVY
ncbi:hypothetical protein FXO38_14612 [Capsicum annuum]|nr:hypothetical protein FXO38_14612 [Capsicum annuum]